VRKRFRVGADIVVPVLLAGLFATAAVPTVRYIALVLLVVRAMSFVYARAAARAITVTRVERLIHTSRFAPFEVVLTIRNRLPLPVHYVRVGDRSGAFHARTVATFAVGLGPFEETRVSYTLEGHERGEFRLGPIDIAGTDALGFYSFARQIPDHAQVVVYPSIFSLDMSQKTGLPSGNLRVASRLYEDITRFRSIREYQPGDELKRVNWKASARLNKLFTTEYEPSIYFPALVLLNLTDTDYPQAQRQHLVERAIEMAASLLFYFVGLKQQVGLLTTGRIADSEAPPVAPLRPGYGHAKSALEILARIATTEARGSAGDFTDLVLRGGVAVPTGTRIVVVSPPLRPAQVTALLALRRRGYEVEVFLVSSQSTAAADLEVPGLRSHRVAGYGKALVDG
jgi:uncharacterized protein (DUF58 family)